MKHIKAEMFRACDDIDNQYVTSKTEFKTVREAKIHLRRICAKGFIDAKIRGNWIRIYEFYYLDGFKRMKVYNGLDEAGYVRF